MSKFNRITLSRRSMLATAGALLASPRLPSFAHPAGTVNILFDSWSTQVLYQRKPPNPLPISLGTLPGSEPERLKTLFHTIKKMGWHKHFTEPPITPSQLNGKNVYVSLTRYFDPSLAYQTSELDAIHSWVKTGGNVLLMTNHGASASMPNWTHNDKDLAARFGVTLSNYFVGPGKESLPLSYPKPCSEAIARVLSMSVLPAR